MNKRQQRYRQRKRLNPLKLMLRILINLLRLFGLMRREQKHGARRKMPARTMQPQLYVHRKRVSSNRKAKQCGR